MGLARTNVIDHDGVVRLRASERLEVISFPSLSHSIGPLNFQGLTYDLSLG